MKKRFTEAPITFALRQAASGTPVSEITRKMGASIVAGAFGSKRVCSLMISSPYDERKNAMHSPRKRYGLDDKDVQA